MVIFFMENAACNASLRVGLKLQAVEEATGNIGSQSSLRDGHISPENLKWVKDNLKGLHEKVKKMLNLINEDAVEDSFAKRAEIYYQRRPELVSLVEEFYGVYVSLAERCNYLIEQVTNSIPSPFNEHYCMDSSPSRRSARESEMEEKAIGLDVFLGTSNTDLPQRRVDSIHEDCKDSGDISCVSSLDTEYDNSPGPHHALQHLIEENEPDDTHHNKITEQLIRQFQRDILKLREENETLRKQVSVGESDLQKQIVKLEARNSDLESKISSLRLQINESSEKSSPFLKADDMMREELQADFTKGQEPEREMLDLQQKLHLSGEEDKLVKTEVHRRFQSCDVDKKKVRGRENDGLNMVYTPKTEIDKMKCELPELQDEKDAVRRQIEGSTHMESSAGHNYLQAELSLLEEENSNPRSEASVVRQRMKDTGDQASNLLMGKENPAYDSMQKQITYLQQEWQAKTDLVQVLQEQIEDLQQTLLDSQCEIANLRDKYRRCMNEYGLVNGISKTLQSELARGQEENQKLRRELSMKFTELKNLEVMFSSLGKEKEVIAAELLRKTNMLDDMEEQLNDLKQQNRRLSSKLESYAREQKLKIQDQVTVAGLQDRNKLLADQLLKSSEGCRALKRKLKELQQQNRGFQTEIAKLRTCIQKKEEAAHLLELEKTLLQNEISWGKEQLQLLQEKCNCFNEKTQPQAKQLQNKSDCQKSLNDEVVSLEQLLLQYKEEITSLKIESQRRAKECQFLKGHLEELQSELILLRAKNNSLQFERSGKESLEKLNADNSYQQNENKISSGFEQIENSGKGCGEIRYMTQELSQRKGDGTLILQHNLKQENEHLKPDLQSRCKENIDVETCTPSKQLLQLQDTNISQGTQPLPGDDSTKKLKNGADTLLCTNEGHHTEATPINTLKERLNKDFSATPIQDDFGDIASQALNKVDILPKPNDDGFQGGMAQKSKLEHEIRKLQAESDILKEDNMNLKAEFQTVKRECCSFQNSLDTLQKQLSLANERLQLLQKQVFSLHEGDTWLKNNASESGPVTKTVGQEVIRIEKELSVKLEEVNKLIRELQEHSDGSHQDNFRLNSASEAYGSRMEELQSVVRKLDLEVKILKAKNERQSIILSDRTEEKKEHPIT